MNKEIKKSFERLQKVAAMLYFVFMLFICSCNKNDEFTNDDIKIWISSFSLESGGSSVPDIFIGEWNPFAFAYKANEKKIKNIVVFGKNDFIHSDGLIINEYPDDYEFDEALRGLIHMSFNNCGFVYSKSSDLINYSYEFYKSPCFAALIPESKVEIDIKDALKGAYRFVNIKDDLIIHFKGASKKNLLILKKR